MKYGPNHVGMKPLGCLPGIKTPHFWALGAQGPPLPLFFTDFRPINPSWPWGPGPCPLLSAALIGTIPTFACANRSDGRFLHGYAWA